MFARKATAAARTGSQFARYLAEFMGAEAVHRALALQSLGKLGNDRAFMRFGQREETPGLPTTGKPGFYRIATAVDAAPGGRLRIRRGGPRPGAFYEFDEVSKRTPDPSGVHTRSLS